MTFHVVGGVALKLGTSRYSTLAHLVRSSETYTLSVAQQLSSYNHPGQNGQRNFHTRGAIPHSANAKDVARAWISTNLIFYKAPVSVEGVLPLRKGSAATVLGPPALFRRVPVPFGGLCIAPKEPASSVKDNSGMPLPQLLCGGHSIVQCRFVARVKVHRFAGVVPLKIRSPKSEWYIQAEKEFLSEREEIPEGYIERWREKDLEKLNPAVRYCLSLRCASNKQIHQWRKLQLCRQLQRRPFDTGSSAVQIACLTEKILNARQHLLKHRRDHSKKRILSIWLARRQRVMKYLYRTDYDLYRLTCSVLRIKCVHFAIPDSRDRKRAISPVAVDGDRCKFLIRQRLWKGRYRPRPIKLAEGKTVRYTRHVMEQPPPGWNMPHETKPRISRAWPYGVKEERLKGEYTIANPTAAGIGYCPVPLFF